MARKTNVNYFASRGGYYCQINRKQYLLASGPDDAPAGPTYEAALKAYRQLLERQQAEVVGDGNTVRTVCSLFLERTETRVQSSSQNMRQYYLTPLVEALGSLRVGELTVFRIEGFLLDMRKPRLRPLPSGRGVCECSWGDSSVTLFLKIASAAFAWGVRQKLITSNPFVDVPKPGIRSRGRDCLIEPAHHQALLSICRSSGTRQLLIVLENTGARPSEITAAESRYWDAEREALFYPVDTTRKAGEHRHKSAAHKDRTIFFSGEALELVRQLVKTYPNGPLFRNSQGHPTSTGTLQQWLRDVRLKVGLPGLTAYSYRHTFATNWLKSGRSIEILAELLGNTPEVIRKHYSHLCGDWRNIRQHLDSFRLEGNTSTRSACPTCGRPFEEPPEPDAVVSPPGG